MSASDIFNELRAVPSINRIDAISFIGGIDSFKGDKFFSSGSRLDHSIGVANIVDYICQVKKLSTSQRNTAVSYAILHDIGHPAFSHSGEIYLKNNFQIDHHDVFLNIISTDNNIFKSLNNIGVSLDDIMNISNNNELYDKSVNEIFANPLNADTIEGIFRASRFFGVVSSIEMFSNIIRFSMETSKEDVFYGDYFWNIKNNIYNNYILSGDCLIYDNLVESFLNYRNADMDYLYSFDPKKLESEFSYFCKKFDFEEFREGAPCRHRVFEIDRFADIVDVGSLSKRYKSRWVEIGRKPHS